MQTSFVGADFVVDGVGVGVIYSNEFIQIWLSSNQYSAKY